MSYNILILNYEYPPLGGGAGIITRHLAREFNGQEHKVTVLTTIFDDLEALETEGELTIIRLPARRKSIDRSNVWEMYSYMKVAGRYAREHFVKGQFDICLANFTLPCGAVALQMKKEIGLPYAIVSHGHDIPWFYPKQMFFWHLLTYPIIRRICLESGRNIILTEEMKRIADAFIGKKCDKNVIIANGIHEQELDYDEKPHDKLRILFAARLVEQKGPILFMKVMTVLKEQGLEFEAHVLGDGALKKKLWQQKDKYQLDNVHLEGKVPHNRVIDFMKEAHLLLAPSTHEAMSVTILEALSCGLYILTTPISGNTDIPEENGALIDSRQPEKFAEGVMEFYRENFAKGNFRRSDVPQELLQHYNWQVVSERYIKVFEDIIGEVKNN